MPDRLIYESRNSRVFRSEDNEWGRPAVVKVLNDEFPSPQSIKHFYNEYEVLQDIDIEGVRQALWMGRRGQQHAMALDWVEGRTTAQIAADEPPKIADFLSMAIDAARIVDEVHRAGVIHKDISGHNLLVDETTGSVHLIDFGISTQLDLKEAHLGNPERLEGNLGYISPEQTGRMNRIVDARSDLYSLGVTFYELLTGRLPFKADDALELVHAHIAVAPAAVTHHRPEVPEAISDIIDRLLAKNAEDRYQSAFGLGQDLQHCLVQFEKTGSIEPFTLGAQDFSGRFTLPQRLYGRESELQQLLGAFGRVADGGLETVLVAGYSGTGKSALVHEIHKPITRRRGYFISGKFDQFQRAVPYFALIEAFQDLVGLMLTENEDRLAVLRDEIQEAVGSEGRVLTDVIPRLEHIIGAQPEVPEVGGNEAANRFNYVFRKFVKVVSTADHPVVLFIDDLQWADSSSLNLLRVLMTDPDNQFLLCVCAYRDNEVDDSHPFITTVAQMEEFGASVSRIHIDNLRRDDVQALVGEALLAVGEEAKALTGVVYDKTQGNAFFVTQFLKSLYDEELLWFDFDAFQWRWDVKQIVDKGITDNVVELLAGKIQKLPEATQDTLRRAACIGNSFEVETLSVIHERPQKETEEDLRAALKEGLVLPGEGRFHFAHDRIQQAVYSLIPEDERAGLHLRIGRLLLQGVEGERREEQLFDIVNQVNDGLALVSDPDERTRFARLNLEAGMKAKVASAFRPAYDYLTTGIDLLKPEDLWSTQFDLALPLHTNAAEVAYYNADFEPMDRLLDAVLDHATEMSDRFEPYAIRINALKAQNRLQEAIDIGLEVLEQLGESFPKRPIAPLVMADLAKTKLMLRGKTNDDLATLPEMTDPLRIAAMRILNDIASPAYWARPEIMPFLLFRMVQLSLKFGVTSVSSFGFATYGLLMCGVLGAMQEGYRFGQLGLRLLERFDAKEWLSQTYTPIYALINHWSEHVHLSLEPFLYSYRIGFETGAIEFACINVNIYCVHCYLGGLPLEKTEREMRAFSERMLEFGQETNNNYNEVYRQAVHNWMGRSEDPCVLTGEAFDQEKMLAQNAEREDKSGTFLLHFNAMILNYGFHRYEQALHHAEDCHALLDAVLAKFEVPNQWFYHALVMLAIVDEGGAGCEAAGGRRKLLGRVRKHRRKLKKWAKDSPDNHAHKLALLEAELARVENRAADARDNYDQAIERASDQKFPQEEALAAERAGLFHLEQGNAGPAEFYLKRAAQVYREWGASAKVDFLAERYPQSVASRGESARREVSRGTSSTTVSDGSSLDLSSVMKASTAISGEIGLAGLLKTMMRIVLESAGAQHGAFLTQTNGTWMIQARGSVDEDVVIADESAADGRYVPESAVRYVARTRERLLVADVDADERLRSDPYVQRAHPRSVLCLPIIDRGELTGMLYLEHRQSEGAFTDDRIALLELLSGQIAVSIDKAIVYENLEEKVRDRTAEVVRQKEEVERTLEQLRATQAQLIQQEKMASLGQMTAGIAHEIQNPLNFVTNFSELNEELTQDLRELMEGEQDPEELDDLVDDLSMNAAQITKHGRRATDIVKAMMQHATVGAGEPAPTDLNALAAEYTRVVTGTFAEKGDGPVIAVDQQLESSLEPVTAIPQEIGRVVINMLNNAFEAVRERAASEGDGYEPSIAIGTARVDGTVELWVRDNGPGIADDAIGKVFEPFYTTKPTGRGNTGLGLSLSFDIVTKGHGGDLSVESAAGEGATFRMRLPLE